ncbi:hypothetical protein HYX14_03765 [Candidatus Woesearchaeota archaeon]|nr:hypothetical protein [Candidatus Woesearchaeota archaeon]
MLDFNHQGLVQKLLEDEKDKNEEMDIANPLILSDSGDYLWGLQCWFAAAKDLRDIPKEFWLKVPEAYRELLRGKLYPGSDN